MADPISSAISAVGGLASSAMGMYEAQENRNFQANMSDTAVQRRMADLKASGVNPILAVSQLGGASTPTGAMPSIPDMSSLGQTINSAKANSIQQQLADATVRKTNADASVQEQTAKNLAQTSPFTNQMPERQLALLQDQVYSADATTSTDALKAIVQNLKASATSASAKAQLDQLSVPAALNSSQAAQTWFGKYIQPYVQSALHGSQMINNVTP